MFNPNTNNLTTTRDVVWVKQKQLKIVEVNSDSDPEDHEESVDEGSDSVEEEIKKVLTLNNHILTRIMKKKNNRELINLNTSFDPTLIFYDKSMVGVNEMKQKDPDTYREVWDHPDDMERSKRRASIEK